MKYLIGDFTQLRDEYPIECPTIKNSVVANDLVRSRDSSDYHVINLDELTYFDPKENKWVGLYRET